MEADNAKYGGFRVKLAVTVSGAGQVARIVIVVSGLSLDELIKCPKTKLQLIVEYTF